MHLEIITPEKTVLKEEVDEVLVPTAQGQIGILPHHVNLVTQITQGEIIIKKHSKEQFFAVTGGFLEVANGKVSVLADYAAHAEDIDVEKALKAQKRAEEVLKKGKDQLSERDFAVASAELRKSLLEIDVVNRRRHRRTHP
jgi:F-type H+-transporting ATPase subunit epsilon